MKPDVLIIGGGVIGLCLADELLRGGLSVTVVDKGRMGREASWAGAGMLTCRPRVKQNPDEIDYHDLCLLSVRLHKVWAQRLQDETGIDVGYRQCGAIELLLSGAGDSSSIEERRQIPELPPEKAELRRHLDGYIAGCNARGVRARKIDSAQARELEPGLGENEGGIEFPDEPQVRNPWFVRALIASVEKQGGELLEGVDAADLDIHAGKMRGVILRDGGRISAGTVAVCAGAWAGQLPGLVEHSPQSRKIEPVRGQLLCYQAGAELARRLLTYGNHYIVPRGDGIILIGATHEKAGFEKKVTAEGVQELERFAHRLLPALKNAAPLNAWSGLRPGLKGKHPIIGPVLKIAGLYIAGGHYRNGLTLAPATAELLTAIIVRKTPEISVKTWLPE